VWIIAEIPVAGKGRKQMSVPIIQLDDGTAVARAQVPTDFPPQVVIHMFLMVFHKRISTPFPLDAGAVVSQRRNLAYDELYRLIKDLT
jgi:hypothetical protein